MTSHLRRRRGPARAGSVPLTLTLMVTLAVAIAGCSYESGDGLAGGDGKARPVTSTTEGPNGPLAFSVEGLQTSRWLVYNTDDGLHLRVAPGRDSASITRLAADTIVTASGNVSVVDDVSWFYVDVDRRSGWVHSGYLAPVESDEEADTAPEPTAALSIVDAAWPADTELVVAGQPGANLREGPGGDTIVELPTGTAVTVTGRAVDDWTEIRTSNLRGWIYTPLLAELTEESDSPFAAATPVMATDGLGGVNLRLTPGGEIIGRIPRNEVALATGRSHGDWTEATHRATSGWARTVQLHVAQPSAGPLEPAAATIDGAGGPVTVHLGPSGIDPIVHELADREQVMTTGVSTPTGWTEIDLDGVRTGWVPTVFLIFDP